MKIEKDSEWLRLVGKVGRLRGDLAEAERRLEAHKAKRIADQLGVTPGESIIVNGEGTRYLLRKVEGYEWMVMLWVSPFRKDGTPSTAQQRIYGGWTKEAK